MCDSIHFAFPELSRWSVLYSELNTMNVAVQAQGKRVGVRMEKTTFVRALFRVGHCVDGLKVGN